MKTFFLSIFAAIGSLFGHHAQTITPPMITPAMSIAPQASSTGTLSVQIPLHNPATTTISTPPIPPVITYPLGSDVMERGKTYAVTWTNMDPHTINYSINVEFVQNGDYFIIIPLGTVSSKAQTLSFSIPTTTPPRTNYQIYFSDAANTRDVIVGSQTFTIK